VDQQATTPDLGGQNGDAGDDIDAGASLARSCAEHQASYATTRLDPSSMTTRTFLLPLDEDMAATALRAIARGLAHRERGLAGTPQPREFGALARVRTSGCPNSRKSTELGGGRGWGWG